MNQNPIHQMLEPSQLIYRNQYILKYSEQVLVHTWKKTSTPIIGSRVIIILAIGNLAVYTPCQMSTINRAKACWINQEGC